MRMVPALLREIPTDDLDDFVWDLPSDESEPRAGNGRMDVKKVAPLQAEDFQHARKGYYLTSTQVTDDQGNDATERPGSSRIALATRKQHHSVRQVAKYAMSWFLGRGAVMKSSSNDHEGNARVGEKPAEGSGAKEIVVSCGDMELTGTSAETLGSLSDHEHKLPARS
ncbi:hypothetical protein AAVH_02496 [Aphelenchoides avenae]|nr:hypothetical protein AAVH_02496 [Aphelenchus avenae]